MVLEGQRVDNPKRKVIWLTTRASAGPEEAKMIQQTVRLACRAWFAWFTLVGLAIAWSGSVIICAVIRDQRVAQGLCCRLCHYVFRWFLIKSCPWIRVTLPPAEDVARLMDRERVCLLMNHTSFFDSVLFVGTTPPGIIWRYRTLMKAGLFNVSEDCSWRYVQLGRGVAVL